ncbi:hypothetical protein [Methanosarcina lacustris]|nr:hypothetical protein [Methanosarcina lacustris]
MFCSPVYFAGVTFQMKTLDESLN